MEGKSRVSKLRSQIENVVVKAIRKHNESDRIYNSCSFQMKEIIAIK